MFNALQSQAKMAIASSSLAVFSNARQAGYHRISDSGLDRRMMSGLLNIPSTMRHGRDSKKYYILTGSSRSQNQGTRVSTNLSNPRWEVINPIDFTDLENSEGYLVGNILDILDFALKNSQFDTFEELGFGPQQDHRTFDNLIFHIIVSTGLVHALGSPENAANALHSMGGVSDYGFTYPELFPSRHLKTLVSSWATVGKIAGLQDVAKAILQARCFKWGIEEIETAKDFRGAEALVRWLFADYREHLNDSFSFNVVSVNGGRAGSAALFANIEYFIYFGFPLTSPIMIMTRYGLRAVVERGGLMPFKFSPESIGESTSPLRSRENAVRIPPDSNRFRREQKTGEFRDNVKKEVRIIKNRLAQDPIYASFAHPEGLKVGARKNHYSSRDVELQDIRAPQTST